MIYRYTMLHCCWWQC